MIYNLEVMTDPINQIFISLNKKFHHLNLIILFIMDLRKPKFGCVLYVTVIYKKRKSERQFQYLTEFVPFTSSSYELNDRVDWSL